MKKEMNIIDYIFPRYCISCGALGAYLCPSCKKKLIPHPEICPYCHKSSPHYQTCAHCRQESTSYLEGLIIPFAYTQEMKRLILKLKYYHQKDIVSFLVDRAIRELQSNPKCSPHYITSVPSHRWRKYFIKGYNQSELLAKHFAKESKIPYQDFVHKIKYTKSQAGLNRQQRLKNLQGAFSIAREQTSYHGQLLIIDDVTTTGATLNHLAKTIKQQFPQAKIRGLVLCRHLR